MSETLFLEDLPVGRRFESRAQRIDAEEIQAFAERYDPQVFHLDPEAARETLFRGLAASGWHTAAFSMRLLVESVPIAGGIIGSGNTLEWPRPTRPGDVLRVISEVTESTESASRPDRGRIVLRSETLNQNDEIAQILTARLIVRRRAQGKN